MSGKQPPDRKRKEKTVMETNSASSATVITGRRTRLSYVNLFEPRSFDGQKPMYSVSLIIPKEDNDTVEQIRSAIRAAYHNGAGRLRENSTEMPSLQEIHLPLNDGDKNRPTDPAYANAWYVNAKSMEKPRLFGQDGREITDHSDLYSGCYARCKITFYAYSKNGNKGIACTLEGLRKSGDGDPLGSICTADDFAENPMAGMKYLA